MPFQPGQSGNPAGKKPGTLSKTTTAAKEAFQAAFDEMGGVEKLVTWAKDNQTDFYKLYGRLIPLDVNNNHGVQDSLAELMGKIDGRSRDLPKAG